MAHPGVPDDELLLLLNTLKRFDGNQTQAAHHMGMVRQTFITRLATAKLRLAEGSLRADKPFDVPTLPDGTANAEELLERRKKDFVRVSAARKSRRLIEIPIRI